MPSFEASSCSQNVITMHAINSLLAMQGTNIFYGNVPGEQHRRQNLVCIADCVHPPGINGENLFLPLVMANR